MEKVWVNGSAAHPIFKFLKSRLSGSFGNFIKWNYTKFLCDRDGVPVKRFAPKDEPLSMEPLIRELLGLPEMKKEADEPEVVATEEPKSEKIKQGEE
eukprot:m.19494 g.19494  ORF g.19494 m.19494 type:complete len:97 (+) comp5126_c0_seq1:1457-1747(+)